MPNKFMLKSNCLLHPSCKASATVNMVDLCYECWNKASDETREKIKRVTSNWSKGLLTLEDLHDDLARVAFDAPELMSSQEPEVKV